MTTHTDLPAGLSQCELDQLHLTAGIQAYGLFLVLDAGTQTIIQTSSNTKDLLDLEVSQVLGRPFTELFGDQIPFRNIFGKTPQPFSVRYQGESSRRSFVALAHAQPGMWIVDLEPDGGAHGEESPLQLSDRLNTSIARLYRAETLSELFGALVPDILDITGFERVLVYRFHDDWHGEVVSEETAPGLPDSYMGLHFPAQDIPGPARLIYQRNPLRFILDAAQARADLVPELNPLTGDKTDMTLSVLRAVSPSHAEYLGQMGVKGSMSLPLMLNDTLWGLIVCHHRLPRMVPHTSRMLCNLLARIASLQLMNRSKQDYLNEKLHLKSTLNALVMFINEDETLMEALTSHRPGLLELFSSDGAIVVTHGERRNLGHIPPEPEIGQILEWLARHADGGILSRNSMPEGTGGEFSGGFLYIRLSGDGRDFILCFRKELMNTVRWCGNPYASVAEDIPHPVNSFERWQEEVRGLCTPWSRPCWISPTFSARRFSGGGTWISGTKRSACCWRSITSWSRSFPNGSDWRVS